VGIRVGLRKLIDTPLTGCLHLTRSSSDGAAGIARDGLKAWAAICASQLPDMPHEKLFAGASHFHLILSTKRGKVYGGATFRLIRGCVSAERYEPSDRGDKGKDGRRPGEAGMLVLEVLSMAVAEEYQRHGHGSSLVAGVKAIACEEASALGLPALLLAQADLRALTFWRKHGLHATRGASKVLHALSRWRDENVIYSDAAAMAVQLSGKIPTTKAHKRRGASASAKDEGYIEMPGKRRRLKHDYKQLQCGPRRKGSKVSSGK